MENRSLVYFGQIDVENLEEYYNVKIDFKGTKVALDLNFGNKSIDENLYEVVNVFLGNLVAFDNNNKAFINNDFKDGGETSEYLSFYLEELDESELSTIIDAEDNTPEEMQLLNKLRLIRVGLYPDSKYGATFAIFDYSIDIYEEPFDYLLVVKTNEQGDLDHITWES
jgi:hypothetical protein